MPQNTSPGESSAALSAFSQLWPYLAGLIIIAVVGGVLIMWIRRSLLSKQSGEADQTLMETLRRMRDSGEISPDEYDTSVRSIAQRVASRLHTPKADSVPSRPQVAKPPAPNAPPKPEPKPAGRPADKPAPPPPSQAPIDDFPPLTELPPEG